MAVAPRRWAAELLHFWFHTLKPRDWFGGGPAVDAQLRTRFAPDLAAMSGMSAQSFLTDPLTARAAILLFDQVPRNLFRGTAEAFAYDPLARHITHGVLAREWDLLSPPVARQFIAMPLMHSEDIVDQQHSVAYFTWLGPRYGAAFARSHYRMIARFGRFPHRNPVLGRISTPAEIRAVAAGNSW